MFGVDASSAEAVIYYQWYKNNVGIIGATDATYTISNVVESDAGSYFVQVHDGFNSINSNTAQLFVPDNLPANWITPTGTYAMGPQEGDIEFAMPGSQMGRAVFHSESSR